MDKDIITQMMTRPGLTIAVTSEELMEFSRSLITAAEKRIRDAAEAKSKEIWLTSAEACQRTGLSLATLGRWTNRGKLHPIRRGAIRYYSEAEIQAVKDGKI